MPRITPALKDAADVAFARFKTAFNAETHGKQARARNAGANAILIGNPMILAMSAANAARSAASTTSQTPSGARYVHTPLVRMRLLLTFFVANMGDVEWSDEEESDDDDDDGAADGN